MGRFCAIVITMLLVAPVIRAQEPYKVLTQWTIGGQGGWDYLADDPSAHRLYITHRTRVEVLDTTTGKQVGSMSGFQGLHGVALPPKSKLGFLSDGGANAVIVFDRHTLAKLDSIPAGTNPDGIVYEPVTNTVWAFNGRSHNVTVIDAAQRKVVATLDLPGKPEFPTADGKGNVYDNIEDKSEIVRFDAVTRELTATWTLGSCRYPSGMAIDNAGMRLFSVCDNKVMAVLNARDGKLLANPPIGEGPDAARYDAARKLAFSSNGEGTLTVVDAAGALYPVLETLTTKRGARTMALDPVADRLYLVTADFGPPPAATADHPHQRPSVLPGTFTVLVVGRK